MVNKVKNYLYPRSRVFHEIFGVGEVVDLSPSSNKIGVKFGNDVRYVHKTMIKKLVVATVK